jgi:hypothetical protein
MAIEIGSGIDVGPGIDISGGILPGGSMYYDIGNYEYYYNSGSGLTTSSTDVTVEFWMYPTSSAVGVFAWNTDGGYFRIGYSGGSLTVAPPAGATMSYTVTANTWTYICTGNFNGAGRLTVNGINRGSSGTSNYNWSGSAYVGANDLGQFFDGYITNLRISNADVNGIGGGGGCSVPSAPLTASGSTLLLLNATSALTVTADSSGNGIVDGSARPPSWSALTPY